MVMRVGIIGCGLIGRKRAKALGEHILVAVADTQLERAQSLAKEYPECVAFNNWEQLVQHPELDIVIVATTNNALAPITQAAIQNAKHVLVEKPAGITPQELQPLVDLAHSKQVIVKVGFNHRFHPGFQKAMQIFRDGKIGPLMYIRARYGHGGRIGYDREWRANPAIAGGGELLDQGVHLIDLSRWFAGDFNQVHGSIKTYFWDMPVEDNGFLFLKTPHNQVAWLHASCTEWKNLFCFEIFGRDGKLQIDGLGGSYGVERLSFYKMLPQMGPPETTIWEYPGEDRSWNQEFTYFVDCIRDNIQPEGSLKDAQAALHIIQQVYQTSL